MITRRTFTKLALSGLAAPFFPAVTGQDRSALDRAIAPMSQLHSIQVRLGDRVVYSAAPNGPGLDQTANITSCSKSIVSLLLGTCIDRGDIPSLDAPLVDTSPSIVPAAATNGVEDITIRDLVTMRAGLQGTSGGRYGAWVASDDWLTDALTRPMVAEPGSRMIYSTGTTHVLGATMAEASGQSLLELTRQRLGEPMGFNVPPWVQDPQGYYLGGNEMGLTPRAMLSVAQLVRDDGQFAGRQVIPAQWIRDSIVPRTQSPWSGMGYGYGWFVTDTGYVLARGYGGQIIATHREAGLAVAITSDPTRPAYSGGYFGDLMALLDGPVLEFAGG